MAVQTRASQPIVNMMKEDLAEKIFIHMNLKCPEMQIFKLKTRALNGKYYRLNFQVAGNTRFEPRKESAFLPGQDPDSLFQDQVAGVDIQELQFGPRYMYSAVDWTGPMRAAVKSKEGGYENIMDFRIKDTQKHMVEQAGIALCYGAHSIRGRIKTMNKTTGVVTLYGADEVGAGSGSAIPEVGNRLIRPGHVLSAVSSRSGAPRAAHVNDQGRKVTSRSQEAAAPTVTFFKDSASGILGNSWANDDYLILHASRDAAGYSSASTANSNLYGPMGMLDAVDDGTWMPYYGGIDRTAYESLMCQRSSNNGTLRQGSLDLLNQAVGLSEERADGAPDKVYCTPGVRRQFVKFLTATVVTTANAGLASENPTRYNNPGAEKVTIGLNQFDVMTLGPTGRMTFVSSRLAPAHSALIFDSSTCLLMQDSPPDFLDEDGLKMRLVTGKDEFQSFWKWYVPGIICQEPWKNVRIDDLRGDLLTA